MRDMGKAGRYQTTNCSNRIDDVHSDGRKSILDEFDMS